MRVTGSSIQQLEKDRPKGKCRRWRLWLNVAELDKRPSKYVNGTYGDAKTALEAFIAEYEQKPTPAGTFGAYALKWLEWREKSHDFAPGTIENNRSDLNRLRRSDLWEMELTKITAADCRDALTWIKENPQHGNKTQLGNTTMNKLFITLCAVLGQAWEDALIPANPMSRIKAPRPDTEEKEALPPSELFALLDKLDALPMDGRIMAVYFIACLGLRRGEACAIYSADINGDLVTIDKAIKERDGTIGAPKSPSGIRTLPMPERLQTKALEWLKTRDSLPLNMHTICCNTKGGVLRPQLLQRWWSGDAYHTGIRESLECPDITLHQLRHSNLSMVARYMSPFDLKTYAGWSSIEPAKIYIHDDLNAVKNAVNQAWNTPEIN